MSALTTRVAAGLVAFLILGGGIEPLRSQSSNVDEVLARFVNAPSREAAEEAARAIAGSTAAFETIVSRLRSGRAYQKGPAGTIFGSRAGSARVVHPYFFVIPASYDPAKKYPVRFYLHGGVGRPGVAGQRAGVVSKLHANGPRRCDCRVSGRLERVALVGTTSSGKPRGHSRSSQAHLQRRREPRVSARNF